MYSAKVKNTAIYMFFLWPILYLSLGFDESLLFSPCDRRICVNLTVENDETLEKTESFEVTLERTPGLDHRILLAPVTAEINIIDDDGMLDRHVDTGTI